MRLIRELGLANVALLNIVQAVVVHEHWWNISYATANPDGVSHHISSLSHIVSNI